MLTDWTHNRRLPGNCGSPALEGVDWLTAIRMPMSCSRCGQTAHATVIQAAYRALAALYHPDRNQALGTDKRMAELNAAYEAVRTPARRELYDRMLSAARPVNSPAMAAVSPPTTAAPPSGGVGTLDFGRYAGWTIQALARHDPDYLKWLARHSSGIRYRSQIEVALREAAIPKPSDRMRSR
jgi:curved DNA-binding protein CbpA